MEKSDFDRIVEDAAGWIDQADTHAAAAKVAFAQMDYKLAAGNMLMCWRFSNEAQKRIARIMEATKEQTK